MEKMAWRREITWRKLRTEANSHRWRSFVREESKSVIFGEDGSDAPAAPLFTGIPAKGDGARLAPAME